ncbi:hypothetical protein ACFE04_007815 [Oxalis oulophora]
MEFDKEAAAASKALGSLFKLTEVYIWEDGSKYTRLVHDYKLQPNKTIWLYDDDEEEEDDTISRFTSTTRDCSALQEDDELTRQMNDLGLPLSFNTSKKEIKGITKSKKKGTSNKHSRAGIENGKKDEGGQLLECNGSEAYSRTYLGEEGEEFNDSNDADQPKISKPDYSNHNSETVDQENFGSSGSDGDFGDWKLYWDSYYERNFYYNIKTNISTWDPPPGMEHITTSANTEKCDEMIEDMTKTKTESCEGFSSLLIGAVSDDYDLHGGLVASNIIDKVDIPLDLSTTKRKKKARKKLAEQSFSYESEEVHFEGAYEEYPANVHKYWCQRYLLFSKFDDGIIMDEEGWFSVTPEPIARHHALRCGDGTIVDCFTGAGGNAIQFAQRSKHVIAIDIDPMKISYAHHNAAIYGVEDQIDFITGDFFILAPKLKADVVFLSPPWGGPDYNKVKSYDIYTMLKPHDGYLLFNTAKAIASKIVMFLPRNVNLCQLADLCLSSSPPWSLEVEKNFLNGRLKAITAYFNNTAVIKKKK